MTIPEIIERIQKLNPETELRFLEAFLLGLTVGARLLCSKHPDSNERLRILSQINEINHRLLNRVSALRGGDVFFTVEYSWHAVEEHFDGAPGLGEWVVAFADVALVKHGA